MNSELAGAVYDHYCPGWRDAKLSSGNRRVHAPYRDDHKPSLDISESKLVWIDRATGDGGGAWDLAVLCEGSPEAAADKLRELEGPNGLATASDPRADSGRRQRIAKEERQADRGRIEYARKLWREAEPAEGTPAEVYLRARGYGGPIPPALRFLANHATEGGRFSTMVGAIKRVGDQGLVGVHCTFLREDGSGKAEIECAKKMRGHVKGGAVRLHVLTAPLVVTEGIESGLSVQAATRHAVWAALSAGGIESLELPEEAREVIVGADHDASGRGFEAAHKAARRWTREGRRVSIALPLEPGTDFNDLNAEEIRAVFDAAEPFAAERGADGSSTDTTSVASVASVAAQTGSDWAWPDALTEPAYHGIAGTFVRMIEPHTEADPAGLLLQFLDEAGNLIGRTPHFVAEADRHYTNLFVVLAGTTAKGRKGSSHGQVHARLAAVDSDWAVHRKMSGLSSGEGLIWQVRDPIEKREPVREKGRIVDYQDVVTDPGVDDKRLVVVEPEFASTLRVLGRDGNTLSAVIRQAWDSGNLRTLTKNSPAQATDAHISIIGHVTRDELRRYLDRTELGNGFANRFLWCCVRRSKVLPEGGRLQEVDFAPVTRELQKVIAAAREVGELHRDDRARALWHEVYGDLSGGRPGLLGATTSRAEAQVMRLAMIYALLDGEGMIQLPHLSAALEIWRYCADSARFVFGGSLGDPDADEILRALRRAGDEGLTRTQIRDLLGRHRPSDRPLGMLFELGLVDHATKEATGGRHAQRWFARSPGATKATKATEGGPAEDFGRFGRAGTSSSEVPESNRPAAPSPAREGAV